MKNTSAFWGIIAYKSSKITPRRYLVAQIRNVIDIFSILDQKHVPEKIIFFVPKSGL